MILSLEREVLKEYTAKQLNFFFPDPYAVDLKNYKTAFDLAIDRLLWVRLLNGQPEL